MEALIFLIALALIAIIPAKIAESKGYDFWTYYWYGVVIWIVAVIHAASLRDKTQDSNYGKGL